MDTDIGLDPKTIAKRICAPLWEPSALSSKTIENIQEQIVLAIQQAYRLGAASNNPNDDREIK